MIRRSVFEAIGRFSAEFFMYSEDIELCYKARAAGWRVYYIPTAVVMHHGGGSSAKAPVSTFASVMSVESRWLYFRKTRSIRYANLYRVSVLASSVARLILLGLLWPLAMVSGRSQLARGTARKWLARVRWALGGESQQRGA